MNLGTLLRAKIPSQKECLLTVKTKNLIKVSVYQGCIVFHEAIHVDGYSANRTFYFHRRSTELNMLESVDNGTTNHVIEHVKVKHFILLNAWVITEEIGFQ